MASLQAIAELAWRQIYPNPKDETAILLEEFIETAKVEYAYRVWELNRQEYNSDGANNIPPNLLTEAILKVEDGRASIKDLKALRSLPQNSWIQALGSFMCGDCRYTLMDINKWKLLCDDPSRGQGKKAAIVIGNSMSFPEGIYGYNRPSGEVQIVYANMGGDVDDETEIEDAVGGLVRRALIDIYTRKGKEDKTNNSNGNDWPKES